MALNVSLTGMMWDSFPTLYFDENCSKEVQAIFTLLLGGSVGVVLTYIVYELIRILND